MNAAGPGRASLPDSFPIFPLAGALLLPHGRLPLNIFEPRYVAMIEDALSGGRHIAMIQPNTDAPPAAHGPALHRIGCLGRLTSFAETEDGRYLITLGGIIRFAVAEELEPARGYRRVRGDFAGFHADLAPAPSRGFRPTPPDLTNPGPAADLDDDDADAPDAGADTTGLSRRTLPGMDRGAMYTALRAYFTRHAIDVNWSALDGMDDQSLVRTLSMACPFQPVEKQALLEASGPPERAQTLLALLQMDMHEPDADAPRRRPS